MTKKIPSSYAETIHTLNKNRPSSKRQPTNIIDTEMELREEINDIKIVDTPIEIQKNESTLGKLKDTPSEAEEEYRVSFRPK